MVEQELDRRLRIDMKVVPPLDEVIRKLDHLEDIDRVVLLLHGLSRLPEHQLLADGRVNDRIFGRCIVLAADALAIYLGVPREHWFRAVRRLCRLHAQSGWAILGLATRRILKEPLTDRENAVLDCWLDARKTLGLPRDFDQFRRMATAKNKALGLPADDESVRQDLRVMRLETRGKTSGVYVNRRRILLSDGDYRDVITKFNDLGRSGDQDATRRALRDGDDPIDEKGGVKGKSFPLAQVEGPDNQRPPEELVLVVRQALAALPPEVVGLISEVNAALDAERILDALTQAARSPDPAQRAAILRRASDDRFSRDRLAEVFGTTVPKIRTAEKNSN